MFWCREKQDEVTLFQILDICNNLRQSNLSGDTAELIDFLIESTEEKIAESERNRSEPDPVRAKFVVFFGSSSVKQLRQIVSFFF